MDASHLAYELLTTPGRASAEQGQVMLDGPDGTALTMTPEAAIGTAWSLIQAADAARRQRQEHNQGDAANDDRTPG